MKVGDLVFLNDNYRWGHVYYGVGVIIFKSDYPEDGYTSYRVRWADDSFWHAAEELELISEARTNRRN